MEFEFESGFFSTLLRVSWYLIKMEIDMQKQIVAAILAMLAAVSFAASPTQDENGLVPYYWYKFNGNTTSSGAADSSIVWRIKRYTTGRNDLAVLGSDTHYTSGTALSLGSGAWSVSCTARVPGIDPISSGMAVTEAPIFAAGNGGRDGVALVRTGHHDVKLMTFSGGNGSSATATTKTYSGALRVPLLTGQFHNFILVVEKVDEATVARLYVDGEYKLQIDCPFDRVPTSSMFQLGQVYNGGTSGAISGVVKDVEYDDLRIYQLALSEGQISAIASTFQPWPRAEIADWPDYWFNFDGVADEKKSARQFGSDVVEMKRSNGTYTSMEARSGQAINFVSRSMWSNGNAFAPSTNGNFTVFISAKAVSGSGNVIWFADLPQPLFLATSSTGVALCRLDGSSAVVLANAAVPTAASTFHCYAIIFDYLGGTIRFRVDGAEVGSGVAYSGAAPTGSYKMQFTEFYGKSYPSGYKAATGTYLDDFRLYRRILSVSEIETVEASLTPNRDELRGTPRYWMKFDGNLHQGGAEIIPFSWVYYSYAYVSEGVGPAPAATGKRSITKMAAYTPAGGTGLSFGGRSWTAAARVKVKVDGSGKAAIMCLGRADGGDGAHYLMWESGNVALYKFKSGDSAVTTVVRTNCNASASSFHHYAVTCDSGSRMALYVDGMEAGEGAVSWTQNSWVVQLCKVFNGASPAYTGESGDNLVDDWRAYDRVLSRREIAKLAGIRFNKGFFLGVR